MIWPLLITSPTHIGLLLLSPHSPYMLYSPNRCVVPCCHTSGILHIYSFDKYLNALHVLVSDIILIARDTINNKKDKPVHSEFIFWLGEAINIYYVWC